ncbi:MAG: SAM-dependent methyltransferase [Firmicutes bacterium]|nr:SAM-dependent methyltransferase [Bacillota bacterium]
MRFYRSKIESAAARRLEDRIRREGPLRYDVFLNEALYGPDGYYTRGAAIGKEGDFVTAPHVTPLFGYTLAHHIATIWEQMGCPAPFFICELGAGEGYLAQDILQTLQERAAACWEALEQYVLFERSPVLRAREQTRLEGFAQKVSWTLPHGVEAAVVLSNELFDALPVRIFTQEGGGLREIGITAEAGDLTETLLPLPMDEMPAAVAEVASELQEGWRFEWAPDVSALYTHISEIAKKLAVLTIDYGDLRQARLHHDPQGTLVGYSGQRQVENPLWRAGEIDLSSRVDFSQLIECGQVCGLRFWGPYKMGVYLLALGIDTYLTPADPTRLFDNMALRRNGQVWQLVYTMGQYFQVLLQYRGFDLDDPLAEPSDR